MKVITGKRYGKLVVLKPSHQNIEKRWIWLCQCDCGNRIMLPKNTLDYGRQSCGCDANTKPNLTHGMRYTKEYRTWVGIKSRCLNKNLKDYKRYGGNGIKICKEWKNSFIKFFVDMGIAPSPKHQIDRIDNTKGYYKDNCRWVTQKINTCNRKNSKIWNIKGIVFVSAEDAASHFNVSDVTIHRWCKGGERTIKKDDCYCFNRY